MNRRRTMSQASQIVLVALVAIGSFVVCWVGLDWTSRADESFSGTVVSQIKREVSRRSAQIRLAHLGAEWDGVRVIGPYTPASRLPPPFARDPGLARSRIERRDDITLLAFWRSEHVATVQIPRTVLDLSPLSNQIISRGQCVIINADTRPRATAIADCK